MPKNHWNKGYGRVLAKSYLYYGPKLGYRGSVFNLVYVNNTASIRCASGVIFSTFALGIPDRLAFPQAVGISGIYQGGAYR